MRFSYKIVAVSAFALVILGAAILALRYHPQAVPQQGNASSTAPPDTCRTALSVPEQGDAPLLPISCVTRASSSEPAFSVTINADGSVALQGASTTLSLPAEATDFSDEPRLRGGSVSFEDVTFDGFADLVVVTSVGAYNVTASYYAYDPTTHFFRTTPLVEAVNANIDAPSRTIESFAKGRGIGDLYVLQTYHFENGGYVLVRSETQDFSSSDYDESAGYTRTIEERRDGKMVQVEQRHLSREEVFGE